MTVAATELRVLRKQTAAFIMANPFVVVLQRPNYVDDGAGGRTHVSDQPQTVQTLRLIPQGGPGKSAQARRTIDGELVEPNYALMGKYDANMENGDWFVIDNKKYEVVFVREDRRYEVMGEVFYRG